MSPLIHGNTVFLNGSPTSSDSSYDHHVDSCEVPLAVCGMALRLPGGISTPGEFWDFLISKRDARATVPQSRYNAEKFHSKSQKAGYIRSTEGYFLDDSVDIGALDTTFFTLPKPALERLDPQMRLLLELVHECLESAGECDYRGRDIGCWVGSFAKDWAEQLARDKQTNGMYKMSGHGDFLLSNRISYEYDFKGPTMTISTACSSSLVGLHHACQSLRLGDCSGAIVAGANLITNPTMTVDLTEDGVLSPNASCKTFDADADGYARGEAVNVVYIKRLDDAVRDRNPIRAIIRGTASNSDGRTAGLTSPSADMQVALIRKAYRNAGIRDFSQTGFFECHGTGTRVGDTIETSAIGTVFGDHGIHIGSVKPNVGHSEGASGLTSLIKAILALEHQIIPPNIKFTRPNPRIPFQEKGLIVPCEPVTWPVDRLERVSVNSFGIGGANAHVLIDSGRSFGYASPSFSQASPQHSLLLWTGNTAESVKRQAAKVEVYLENQGDAIADVAYTLNVRRQPLAYRSFSIWAHGKETTPSPIIKSPKTHPAVFMIFTGQGAQYPQMGLQLLQSNRTFAASIRTLDKILQTISDPPTWTIAEELMKSPEESRVYQAKFSQPLCTAIQIALVDSLAKLGIRPYAVVGHSSGEVAAAYAAGKLTAAECIITAYLRGSLSDKITQKGAMAALGIGRSEAEAYLISGVGIACDNSPSSVTISGDVEQVDKVIDAVKQKQPDVLARRLNVDRAYHSAHMREVSAMYASSTSSYMLSHSHGKEQSCLFFSTTTGENMRNDEKTDGAYWMNNLESPVLFYTAIKNLIRHRRATNSGNDDAVFLEVGPHSALAGPLRQIFSHESCTSPYLSCLVRKYNATDAFLTCLGQLYTHNFPVKFAKLSDPDDTANVVADLPTYPWHHDQSLVFETRLTKAWKFPKHKKHELLGVRVAETPDIQPAWRNVLAIGQVPWIVDHVIKGDIIFPCAGYIAMAGEAVRQLVGPKDFRGYSLRDVTIGTAMVLHDSSSTETVTTLKRISRTNGHDSEWYEFAISSHNGDSWLKHFAGQVRAQIKYLKKSSAKKVTPFAREVELKQWYQESARVGGQHGPYFQGIRDVTCCPVNHEASGTAFQTYADDDSAYSMHPTMLDVTFQMFAIACNNGRGRKLTSMNVPTHIEHIDILTTTDAVQFHAMGDENRQGTIRGNGKGITETGETVLRIKNMRLSALPNDEAGDSSLEAHAAARTIWYPHFGFLEYEDVRDENEEDMNRQIQQLSEIYVREALLKLEGVAPSPKPHLERFRTWLKEQPLSQKDLVKDDIIASLQFSTYQSLLETMALILENIVPIFDGTADAKDVLSHNVKPLAHRDESMKLLAHSRPNLKVLQIDSSAGGTAELLLDSLLSPLGDRESFSEYTYTHKSDEVLSRAKERCTEKVALFKALDISRDPATQGFEVARYDLIIASNTLQSASAMANIQKLLRHDGYLYFEEPCCNQTTDFINGLLPEWWQEKGDGKDQPYASFEQLDKTLQCAGFSGVYGLNREFGRYSASGFVSLLSPKAEGLSRTVCLVRDEHSSSDVVDALEQSLQSQGYTVVIKYLSRELVIDCDVIACFDLGTSYFKDMTDERFALLQSFTQKASVASIGVLWLTRSAQVHCADPDYAQTVGATRVIRGEADLSLATCEVDDIGELKTWGLIARIYERFQQQRNASSTDALKPDFEYAISDGKVLIGRVYPISVAKELTKPTLPSSDDKPALHLRIGTFGRLDSLEWVPRTESPLGEDEIEIDIRAVGLNDTDILIATGALETTSAFLGQEAAGIVLRVGATVDPSQFQVGDRVLTLSDGCGSTRARADASQCVKLPDGLTYQQAATMPRTFSSAIYALEYVGRLEKGQSVLIQSACGSVGVAAIQYCKMVGAVIYATVNSDEEVEYLVRTFDIPCDHIFGTHDSFFVERVMDMTAGRGVEIFLNTLASEYLQESWNCVAEFGSLVDLAGHGGVAFNMQPNRSYISVDISRICRTGKVGRLLQAIAEYYAAGHVKPSEKVQVYSGAAVKDAFRFMRTEKSIGQVVLNLEDEGILASPIKSPSSGVQFSPEASYLLVGGLGGLGREVSDWMVERGARHFVYLSRTAGEGGRDQAHLRQLSAQGCSTKFVKGSVTKIDDVNRAVQAAQELAPLKGVINMSMVLRDQSFASMTYQEWTEAVLPKVQGTWNLHNACKNLDHGLDVFLLFSSISGTVGTHGQANYAAANTFMDAFVQYRHGLGLKAAVIDIGLMLDHGVAADNPQMLARMTAAGWYGVRINQLLDCVDAVLQAQASEADSTSMFVENSHLIMGLRSQTPLTSASNRQVWKDDRRMAIYHINSSEDTTDAPASEGSHKLTQFLGEAVADAKVLARQDSFRFLADIIARQLFQLLSRPVEDDVGVDVSQSLTEAGLDSLVAIDMRSWIKRTLDIDVSVLEMLALPSLLALGEVAARRLQSKFSGQQS